MSTLLLSIGGLVLVLVFLGFIWGVNYQEMKKKGRGDYFLGKQKDNN